MNRLMAPIDDFLNDLTMYRLILYGLGILAGLAILFAFAGVLTLSAGQLVWSLVVLLAAAYGSNLVLSRVYEAARNYESWLITALILFFVLPPARNAPELTIEALAALLAMASKYVLAPWRKHIFNPAALGAAGIGVLGLGYGSWWVGTGSLLPFTLILALLVARKIRRLWLVGVFWAVSLIITAGLAFIHHDDAAEMLRLAIVSGPLVFMGGIMLTEPATMPSRERWRLGYAGLVAVLFATHLNLKFVYVTPEIALLIGNILAFAVSPKRRLTLTFVGAEKLAESVYEYRFAAPERLNFQPGQYAEWTLPHRHPDSRGNRRTFSLASAPGSREVRLAVKQSLQPSSFKAKLASLKPGDRLELGPAAGDFTLPSRTDAKLLLIAGGVGITPFASMMRHLLNTTVQRDIVVYYAVKHVEDIAYKDLIAAARAQGMVVHAVAGRLDTQTLRATVPDAVTREVYVSGAPGMVRQTRSLLVALKVPAHHIHTDYFSGY